MQKAFLEYTRCDHFLSENEMKRLRELVPFESLSEVRWNDGTPCVVDGVFSPVNLSHAKFFFRTYREDLLRDEVNARFQVSGVEDMDENWKNHMGKFFMQQARKYGWKFVRLFPEGFFSHFPELMDIERTYALTVLASDGFFEIDSLEAGRFLRIATMLPLELQQVLSNRVHGCGKNYVTGRFFEEALPSFF